MATDSEPALSCVYSHPSLIREHKVVLRLYVTILMNRGVSEKQAKRQAARLFRALAPGKEFAGPIHLRAKAG